MKYRRRKVLFGLTLVTLLGILFFGLRPKDFHFSNNVTWVGERPGIRFGDYAIAHTALSVSGSESDLSESVSFSIEIAIKPEPYNQEGFNHILVLHDGTDGNQLLIGQYNSSLIIMNGDDYRNRRKIKRIVLNRIFQSFKEVFLVITSSDEGTDAYVNGKLIKRKNDLKLRIPRGLDSPTRLVLGNSVYGNDPWQGDLYGLAFYGYGLTSEQVKLHFNRWAKKQSFSFAEEENPFLLYVLDEKKGCVAFDRANGNRHLKIPAWMRVLKRRILTLPWVELELNKSFFIDVIINLAGFIPLGFVFSATFLESGGVFENCVVLIAVVLCFTISLFIEIAQAWLPSRSSQLLDLVLNTGGALIGAIGYRTIAIKRKKPG